jgi:putative intracellular protease/amidase
MVFVGLLVPGVVAAVGIAGARAEVYTPRGPSAPSAPVDAVAAPTHDPAKPTVVILLGPEGANAADVLAPYEVLASTGAFNLYTVAPERQPVPLTGNLDLVPDLSLAQLDQRLPAGPEVIVVPQLTEVAAGVPPSLAPVIGWLQRQRAQGDPLLVSVCVGAQVVAEAGLLDGRPVTSHWLGLIGLRRNYPQVRWTDGVSYVDDGDLISTAGVLWGSMVPCGSSSGWLARPRPPRPPGRCTGRPTPPGRRPRSSGPAWHRRMWWGCSPPATAGTAPPWGSCSPTGSGRPSWPRCSGPTPSCRTSPDRWR